MATGRDGKHCQLAYTLGTFSCRSHGYDSHTGYIVDPFSKDMAYYPVYLQGLLSGVLIFTSASSPVVIWDQVRQSCLHTDGSVRPLTLQD